jgi:diguanylate cyclase (GGDEF)-like protein/PAS domain S-box-containing protein
MRHRIASALLAVTVAALAGSVYLAYRSLSAPLEAREQTTVRDVQALFEAAARLALFASDPAPLQALLQDLTRSPRVAAAHIVGPDGRVLASHRREALGGPPPPMEDVDGIRWLTWRVEEAQPQVEPSERRVATVHVAFAEDRPTPDRRRVPMILAGLATGALVLAALAAWTTSSALNRRLATLRRALDRVTRGDLSVRLSPSGKHEAARLGRAFDRMAVALERNTEALRTSRERFDLAVKGTNDGIWDWDLESGRLYLSPRVGEMLGLPRKDLPGLFTAWLGLIHPDDRERLRQALDAHLERREPFACEVRVGTRGGGWRWLLSRGQAVRDERGQAVRMVGSHTDITDRKQSEEVLFQEKERAQVTLGSIADGVITTGMEGQVEYLNPVAQHLTGWSAHQAQGQPLAQVIQLEREADGMPLPDPVAQVLSEERPVQALEHTVLTNVRGERFTIEHSVAPIRDRGDRVIGAVVVLHNTTEQRALMRRLAHQASHDALTGLPNRYAFDTRLRRALADAEGGQARHVVCYLDLDQFKVVNDTAGHAAGDEMLRQVAQHLRSRVRAGDTLARLGGDEFGLLLERCPLDKALQIAENLRQAIKAFRFAWERHTFSLGVSIGLAPIPASGTTPAEVLSAVDQACYIAKAKGRDRLHVFTPFDSDSSRWRGDVHWVTRIQHALDQGGFLLYAQPIVPLDGSEAGYRHYEVLLRLQGDDGQVVSPGSFLPAAERYGLMPRLDRWVIENVARTLGEAYQRGGLAADTVSINLSGGLLGDDELPEFVKATFAHHRVPPERICFEITETVAIANFARAAQMIRELKALGFRFSLDDFGSGFASFSYLRSLPVDYLKIDGAFVRHMAEAAVDYAMVDVINRIGHVMALKTIAEFVEDDRIVRGLRLLGVDYAQGFHFGRPRPLTEIPAPSGRRKGPGGT